MNRLTQQLFGLDVRNLHFKVNGEPAYELRLEGESPARISDAYTIPRLTDFVKKVFTPERLSPDWLTEIATLRPGDTVLEIGAGDGRVTEAILQTGAHVTAVEPNPEFCPRLSRFVGDGGMPGVRVIEGYFPHIPHERYSHVLMHQNVFLELINEMDDRELLSELRRFVKPGGKILFDYLTDLDTGPAHAVVPIYSGDVPGIGRVQYEREYMGYHWGMRYETVVRFSIDDGTQRHMHSKLLELRLPPMEQILEHLGTLGGEALHREIPAFTFFPGRTQLVTATFAH